MHFDDVTVDGGYAVLRTAAGERLRVPLVDIRALLRVDAATVELATDGATHELAADSPARLAGLEQLAAAVANALTTARDEPLPAWLANHWLGELPEQQTVATRLSPVLAAALYAGGWAFGVLALTCLAVMVLLIVIGGSEPGRTFDIAFAGFLGCAATAALCARQLRVTPDEEIAEACEEAVLVRLDATGANPALDELARRAAALRTATVEVDLDEPPPATALSRLKASDDADAERGLSLSRP